MVGSACKQAAYEEVDGGGARPPVGPTAALKAEGGECRPDTILQTHGRDARATCDGAAQKLKVSVTRLLRPGWVKRGRSARVLLSSRTSCQCQYWRSVRL